MNPFQIISDQELLIQLHTTVKEERRITAKVIDLLREVEYRKLYLKKSYGDLLEFCIKELKYSETSALRRITAMRLSNDVPEICSKIVEGTLSLSVISQAQTFIRREEKSTGVRLEVQVKEELLKTLENKSSRETEKILIEKSPHQVRPEKLRMITATLSELTLPVDQATLEMFAKIKSLISHKNPNPTYLELIKLMGELTLKELDPEQKPVRQPSRQSTQETTQQVIPQRIAAPTRLSSASPSRYIPTQIRREVWKKSQGQCCYRDIASNHRCASRFQLEVDHIMPVARKGLTEINNLQLLCRKHNQMKGFEMPMSNSVFSSN